MDDTCDICGSGVFLPVLSPRASSPPLCGAAPSLRTSSSVRAPAASSSLAPDAVAVGNYRYMKVIF